MQHILLNLVFIRNTAAQKFQFFAFKWPVFMRNILKKIWLKFRIHAKFRAKKKYLFRINAQFRAKLVSYWYENYAKFRAKKSFRAKPRNCCTRESTVSWKPYFWETEGPRAAISLLMLTSSLYSEWGFAV